jgi:hypothetical protein
MSNNAIRMERPNTPQAYVFGGGKLGNGTVSCCHGAICPIPLRLYLQDW